MSHCPPEVFTLSGQSPKGLSSLHVAPKEATVCLSPWIPLEVSILYRYSFTCVCLTVKSQVHRHHLSCEDHSGYVSGLAGVTETYARVKPPRLVYRDDGLVNRAAHPELNLDFLTIPSISPSGRSLMLPVPVCFVNT